MDERDTFQIASRHRAPTASTPVAGELGGIARVARECGDVGRSTVYELVQLGLFPAPIPLTPRRVAWNMDEVRTWREQRMQEARGDDPRAFARRVKQAREQRKTRGTFHHD